MKVLPKSINFSKTAPVSVEEMKDGEVRVTPNTLYGRVGNQVLSMPLGSAGAAVAGLYISSPGDEGHIARSFPKGEEWTDLGHLYSQDTIVDITYCGNGIFVGVTGWISCNALRSTDYGQTWSDLGQIGTLTEGYAVEHLEDGIIVMAPSSPSGCYIYRSINYGVDWQNLGSQLGSGIIYEFLYLGRGIVLAGTSSSGKILRSIDYGQTWQDRGQLGTVNRVEAFAHMGDGRVLAGGNDGTGPHVYRSENYGLNWTEGEDLNCTTIQSLEYLGNGIALAGGFNGNIYRSTNYGKNWSDLGRQFVLDEIYALANLGDGVVVAGTYGPSGHILRSIDYGATWADLGTIASSDWVEAIESDYPFILDATTTTTTTT